MADSSTYLQSNSTGPFDNKSELKNFLVHLNALKFWQTHFKNKGYVLNKTNIEWQKIPFITDEDMIKIGIECRFQDARKMLEKNVYTIILRAQYQRMGSRKVLFLEKISAPTIIGNVLWRIETREAYSLVLRQTLIALHHGYDLLYVDKKNWNNSVAFLMSGLIDSKSAFIVDQLSDLLDVSIIKSNSNKKGLKLTLKLSSKTYKKNEIRKVSNKENVIVYNALGASSFAKSCPAAQKKYGYNAVHPKDNIFIELFGNGKQNSEIVITKTKPIELSLIRYRTGIFGKMIVDRCRCGNNFIILPMFMEKQYYSFHPLQKSMVE